MPGVRYHFEIEESLKGGVPQTLTVTQLGHFQDGRSFMVNPDTVGVPRYEAGQSYILFMNKVSFNTLTSPVGFPHGVIEIHKGAAKSRGGNQTMMSGFDKALAGTAHAKLLDPQSFGKTNLEEGIPVAQLKALINDLVDGKLKGKNLVGVAR